MDIMDRIAVLPLKICIHCICNKNLSLIFYTQHFISQESVQTDNFYNNFFINYRFVWQNWVSIILCLVNYSSAVNHILREFQCVNLLG